MSYLNSIAGFVTYALVYPFKKRKMDVLSLYFHDPSAEAFEKIVLWCRKRNYNFVHIDSITNYVAGAVPKHKKMVHFSFDDGWLTNKALVPIIEKYNVPITIFVPVEPLISGNFWWNYVYNYYKNTNVVEQFKTYNQEKFNSEVLSIKQKMKLDREALTLDELKELNKHPLINIQSHTYTHPILTNVDDISLEYELSNSKKELADLLGKEITVLSYPNGSFSQREVKCAARNYSCAYTTEEYYPRQGGNLYLIPRIGLTDNYWSNLSKMVGAWKYLKLLLK